MPLRVYTARLSRALDDPDALDVTRKSGTAGLFLAPSWSILGPALSDRRIANGLRRTGQAARAAQIELARWDIYAPLYWQEMRDSYRDNRAAWDELLSRPRVVLTCYCTDARHCHRWILRELILPRLGAIDSGEITGEEGVSRDRSRGNIRGPRAG